MDTDFLPQRKTAQLSWNLLHESARFAHRVRLKAFYAAFSLPCRAEIRLVSAKQRRRRMKAGAFSVQPCLDFVQLHNGRFGLEWG
jgi:hypothetical protein